MLDKAKEFGFYSTPPLETAGNDTLSERPLQLRSTLSAIDDAPQVDPGRLAFGQERMLVTPLQMALVAAGVANGGNVMTPHLLKRSCAARAATSCCACIRRVWKHAMKPTTAATLNEMMQAVVSGGTGMHAQIPGIKVAGKTGTAETGSPDVYTSWFIFFAPADNPQVAGAVVVEHQLNGFGGSVAAPIARELMQAILTPPSKQ